MTYYLLYCLYIEANTGIAFAKNGLYPENFQFDSGVPGTFKETARTPENFKCWILKVKCQFPLLINRNIFPCEYF